MKKPIIYGDSIYEKGPFKLFVAAKSEEELPTYIVLNTTTDVIEFTHEVLALNIDWMDHFAPKLAEMLLGIKVPEQKVLPFPGRIGEKKPN